MILAQIVESKKQEVQELLATTNQAVLAGEVAKLPPAKDFKTAINKKNTVSLIAEIKKKSPSKGILCPEFDHRRLAKIYRDNGASALSVLTDNRFFGGKLDYLAEVRQEVDLPLLRKDFIIHPIQIYQSRLARADAVLLIAAILSDKELAHLISVARDIGLQALVEVHTGEELDRVIKAGTELVGINNRNLHTFDTDLATTSRLMEKVNLANITVVSESGIENFQHMNYLKSLGVQGALVGEALVTASDIGLKVREMVKGGGLHAV